MNTLLADSFGGSEIFLLFVGWPVLNWLAALAALVAALKKRRSLTWLVLPAVPIGSAAFLASLYLSDGPALLDTWDIVGFLLPALLGLASAVAIARRAFTRVPQRDEPKG